MEKDKIVEAIVKVLSDLQEMSGRKATPISGNTCPIGGLEGFDSLNGVEATVELSSKLGTDLPGVNYFVSEEGNKALTVTEVADRVCKLHAIRGK